MLSFSRVSTGRLRPFMTPNRLFSTKTRSRFVSAIFVDRPPFKAAGDALGESVRNGMTVALWGSGSSNEPFETVKVLNRRKVKSLTIIRETSSTDDCGLRLLLESQQVSRIITSTPVQGVAQELLKGVQVDQMSRTLLITQLHNHYKETSKIIPYDSWEDLKISITSMVRSEPAPPPKPKTDPMEMSLPVDLSIVKGSKSSLLGVVLLNSSTTEYIPPEATAAIRNVAEIDSIYVLPRLFSDKFVGVANFNALAHAKTDSAAVEYRERVEAVGQVIDFISELISAFAEAVLVLVAFVAKIVFRLA